MNTIKNYTDHQLLNMDDSQLLYISQILGLRIIMGSLNTLQLWDYELRLFERVTKVLAQRFAT